MTSQISNTVSEPKITLLLAVATRIRSAVGILFMIPFTIWCSLLVIAAGLMKQDKLGTRLIRGWSEVALFVFGIRVICEGEEHLPSHGGGIIVFNHQSLFDIPVLMATTNQNIRFGAKIELFKIPFFGGAMRAVGTLPIARESRSEVMRIYKEAESRFKRDIIFVLAPEGTRQHQPVVGRFKKGPFIFAINAGVPIIPAVIKGAHHVLPKNSLSVNFGRWVRDIHVQYLPPCPTKGISVKEVDAFTSEVRAEMEQVYNALPVEP